MDSTGDLASHLRDDINTDDVDVNVSQTPELPVAGAAAADVLVDEAHIITPDQPDTEPIDDEAHRQE